MMSQWVFQNAPGERPSPCSFEDGLEKLSKNTACTIPEKMSFIAPFGGTKILCVGRNYKSHADELANQVPKEPLWFSKPPSSLIGHNGTVRLPIGFGRIEYEGEFAFVISRKCKNVSQEDACGCIAGVTLALDITARELQKADGQWTRAKGFDTFCPLGPFILPFSNEWLEASIKTELNGKVVQSDKLSSMVFSIPRLISHISSCMTLEPGDVILTGTPAGVGEIKNGDRLKLTADGPVTFSLEVQVS